MARWPDGNSGICQRVLWESDYFVLSRVPHIAWRYVFVKISVVNKSYNGLVVHCSFITRCSAVGFI